MSLLGLPFRLSLLFLLVSVVFAQAPRPNGRGSAGLRPLAVSRRDRSVCRNIDTRTLTGQCTSEEVPFLGQARLAQFSYTGASSEIPTGRRLKSAREISNIVFNQDRNIPNRRGINQLFVFFGQFLDHNLAATPELEDEPFDIPVPRGDPQLTESVLEFRRSVRAPADDGRRVRPINTLTSAIDLDAVYGPDQLRNNDLKEFDLFGSPTGRLRTSDFDLLPRNTNGFFNAPDASAGLFVAGDHRVNEHPMLTAIHTLFLREHNRFADMISVRLPSLPKDIVFDYARLLNIAQYQRIVFEEFYPTIIGSRLQRYRGYNRRTDPTVSDIFSGAAYRVGHTMVANNIPRRGRSGRPLNPIPMVDAFFRLTADDFTEDEFENLVRGSANTVAQEVDVHVVDLLRNQLFSEALPGGPFDLMSLNIQRGRDHALPTYNEIRDHFGFDKVTSFSDISSDREIVARLSSAYSSVDDIEAFPGLLAEDHVPGSSVGETMAAVWSAEFTRLRDGDQFFYLNSRVFPTDLRREFFSFIRDLERNRGQNSLRDIILRNTAISESELPDGNIFTI